MHVKVDVWKNTDQSAPVVIGGVGGSGTRLVASLLKSCDFELGDMLNEALDNLWFTLLFRRPSWRNEIPDSATIKDACCILKAAIQGTGFEALPFDVESYIRDLANDMPDFGLRGSRFSSWPDVADDFLIQAEMNCGRALSGWKEPNSHIFLPSLVDSFPNLKYVHVIRDGRYMSQSNNQNQLSQWGHLFNDSVDQSADRSVRALQFWCCSNMKVKYFCENELPERHYWLKFEDLCSQPLSVIPQLLDFLGIVHTVRQIEKFCSMIDAGRVRSLFTDSNILSHSTCKQEITCLGY